jgi:hypothetical protein
MNRINTRRAAIASLAIALTTPWHAAAQAEHLDDADLSAVTSAGISAGQRSALGLATGALSQWLTSFVGNIGVFAAAPGEGTAADPTMTLGIVIEPTTSIPAPDNFDASDMNFAPPAILPDHYVSGVK